ncbi:hypothetical protein SFIMM107S_05147 [Streptomyces griseus]
MISHAQGREVLDAVDEGSFVDLASLGLFEELVRRRATWFLLSLPG